MKKSKTTRSTTSLQEAAYGQSHCETPGGKTAEPLSPGAALASHFQQLENIKEPMIQGTCGRTYIDSSVNLDQLTSLESRLVRRLAMVGSTEYAMILKRRRTPSGHPILRLVRSTRLTNAPGSGGTLWQTPKATPGGYQRDGRTKKVCPNLQGQMDPRKLAEIANWPTPAQRDFKDTGRVSSARTESRASIERRCRC